MKLPRLYESKKTEDMLSRFLGYNALDAGEGEFSYMENMSGRAFPALAPRKKRGEMFTLQNPNGLFGGEQLLYAEGEELYYNHIYVGRVANSKKRFARMGSHIFILPDKLIFNTADLSLKSADNAVTLAGAVFTLTDGEYGELTGYTRSDTAPTEAADGALWLYTGQTPHLLRRYYASAAMWMDVSATYVKITAPGIGAGFLEGDGVALQGSGMDGYFIVEKRGEDYLILPGLVDEAYVQEGEMTVSRRMPEVTLILEKDNRLFACGANGREIYACKLGDPFNWNYFSGTAADSYAASVGTGGAFTGVAELGGGVIFFKEDACHKLYGSRPANFELLKGDAAGVEEGSEDSLTALLGVLYYKGRGGVYAYSGGLARLIGDKLPLAAGSRGGTDGRRYYLAMGGSLYVYDPEKSFWHREDGTDASFFALKDGELYCLAGDKVICLTGGAGEEEEAFCWRAETGEMGLSLPGGKYYSGLTVRAEVGEGAHFSVWLSYDKGEFFEAYATYAPVRRFIRVPLLPRRAETLRIRFCGEGEETRVFSLSKRTERSAP